MRLIVIRRKEVAFTAMLADMKKKNVKMITKVTKKKKSVGSML